MSQKVDQYPSLYPHLDNNSQFRLTEISKLKGNLESEVSDRDRLCKKYKRAAHIFDGIDITASSIALSLSITSGVLASTGVLLPVAIPLAGSAGVSGAVGIICKYIHKKLTVKSQKHALIKQTAESKLNSILDLINKAIDDNSISDSEFKLVVDEVTKYNDLKKKIQTRHVINNSGISEDEKKALIEQTKKDFLDQLR